MTKQITIDEATMQQIVEALEESGRLYCTAVGNSLMHEPSMFDRSMVCKFVRGWFRKNKVTVIEKAITAARAAIAGAELVEPMPSFGNKRKAAMAVYVPPFRFEHGYVFDCQNRMVADNGPICDGPSVEGAVAARVRGWGRLGYLPNGVELQDEIGQMMADALNELYAKESK